MRAPRSSAVEGESPPQLPDSPFPKGWFQALQDFLPSPQRGGGAYPPLCGGQPPASGLQKAWDSYSSSTGSTVPLLHINAKCQTWNRVIGHPPSPPTPTPYEQNVSFRFRLTPGSVSIYNLLEILQRCKLFHTMSQRLQSANKTF